MSEMELVLSRGGDLFSFTTLVTQYYRFEEIRKGMWTVCTTTGSRGVEGTLENVYMLNVTL